MDEEGMNQADAAGECVTWEKERKGGFETQTETRVILYQFTTDYSQYIPSLAIN